jgi:hypothetical protein
MRYVFVGEELSCSNWRCEVKVSFTLPGGCAGLMHSLVTRWYAQPQSAGAKGTGIYAMSQGCVDLSLSVIL